MKPFLTKSSRNVSFPGTIGAILAVLWIGWNVLLASFKGLMMGG